MISDLRALFIGILGGIIAYYATKRIDRYLAHRTIQSRHRQIKQLTQEILQLEKLGVTDRALLLFAFKMLFVLIAVAAGSTAVSVALSFQSGTSDSPLRLILLLVSFVVAIGAFYASNVFHKLDDPEPTLAKLRQKLHELQGTDNDSPTV